MKLNHRFVIAVYDVKKQCCDVNMAHSITIHFLLNVYPQITSKNEKNISREHDSKSLKTNFPVTVYQDCAIFFARGANPKVVENYAGSQEFVIQAAFTLK